MFLWLTFGDNQITGTPSLFNPCATFVSCSLLNLLTVPIETTANSQFRKNNILVPSPVHQSIVLDHCRYQSDYSVGAARNQQSGHEGLRAELERAQKNLLLSSREDTFVLTLRCNILLVERFKQGNWFQRHFCPQLVSPHGGVYPITQSHYR